jgi:DNA-binding LytR/AlgR family response regulator
MKLSINQSPNIAETEIVINCSNITPELKSIIDRIRTLDYTVSGAKDATWYKIPIEKILYFDSVDGKTFIYCVNECYEAKSKLYELEEQLANMSFLRISKNTVINLRALKSTKVIELSRMEITMKNEEHLIVTRHYLNAFKNAFGL